MVQGSPSVVQLLGVAGTRVTVTVPPEEIGKARTAASMHQHNHRQATAGTAVVRWSGGGVGTVTVS